MKNLPAFAVTLAFLFLTGCAGGMPKPAPLCDQPGAIHMDKVFFADVAQEHVISVYLPGCYSERTGTYYPVMYWANGYGQPLYEIADRLVSEGTVPAFIIVEVGIDPNKGYSADLQILNYVVPYIDGHYRTQPDRLQRVITGYSNGGAIAIRAAFRAPDVFSRVAVLSAGIADGEQDKFKAWISAMPADRHPAVLISVGDQDGILLLTHYLTGLLDELKYPYTFMHGSGGHGGDYGDTHLPDEVIWLMSDP
jgi:enterochelin esterase-like enzyme